MSVETLTYSHVPIAENGVPQVFIDAFIDRPAEVQIMPGLGENSSLRKTGFHLPLESTRLFENYNQNLRIGKTPEEALTVTINELDLNIRSFIHEFVQAGVVLPDAKRIQEVNGIKRMVGQNGVPVVDCITSKERYGAVLDATRQVDQFVSADEPQRRVAVINSQNGWNGITRDYLDNQTIISWVDEQGVLHGTTLVTDLNQGQSRQLSIDLGVAADLLTGETEADRVSNIVRNPALLTFPTSDQDPIEWVFDKIIAIRGAADIELRQLDGSVEKRSVEGARKDIKRLNELLKFNQKCEEYLSSLKLFIFSKIDSLNNWLTQQEIVAKIEQTILLLTRDHLLNLPTNSPIKVAWGYAVSATNQNEVRGSEYDNKVIAFLESRAGCSQAGGYSLSAQLRGISLGSGNILSNGVFSKEGKTCISCGELNTCTKTCYKCDGMLI